MRALVLPVAFLCLSCSLNAQTLMDRCDPELIHESRFNGPTVEQLKTQPVALAYLTRVRQQHGWGISNEDLQFTMQGHWGIGAQASHLFTANSSGQGKMRLEEHRTSETVTHIVSGPSAQHVHSDKTTPVPSYSVLPLIQYFPFLPVPKIGVDGLETLVLIPAGTDSTGRTELRAYYSSQEAIGTPFHRIDKRIVEARYFFDTASGDLVESRLCAPPVSNASAVSLITYQYSSYGKQDSFAYPRQVEMYKSGILTKTVKIDSLSMGVQPQSAFTLSR